MSKIEMSMLWILVVKIQLFFLKIKKYLEAEITDCEYTVPKRAGFTYLMGLDPNTLRWRFKSRNLKPLLGLKERYMDGK
jgi:hypothetical protein